MPETVRVEITQNFLDRLALLETWLKDADAPCAFDDLLATLRLTVIPNLLRFPRMGRRYLDNPLQSAEALAQLARLPEGEAAALREYLLKDYLVLYTEAASIVYLLSIRHHRELSFDFSGLWRE
jgi:hypothetical protein